MLVCLAALRRGCTSPAHSPFHVHDIGALQKEQDEGTGAGEEQRRGDFL